MQVKMKFKKSTKRTHVYEAVEDPANREIVPPISVLYIQKSAFMLDRPPEISVTVTYDE